jgi:hypothetical protein
VRALDPQPYCNFGMQIVRYYAVHLQWMESAVEVDSLRHIDLDVAYTVVCGYRLFCNKSFKNDSSNVEVTAPGD